MWGEMKKTILLLVMAVVLAGNVSAADGDLVWTQTINPSSSDDHVSAMTSDASYIYIAGRTSADWQWRIEKRRKSDGVVEWTQTINPSLDTDGATSITSDATYLYIAGYDQSVSFRHWRIEKRLKSNGGLVWIAPMDSSYEIDTAYSIISDTNYLYIVGDEHIDLANWKWRIEKRYKSDGSLIWKRTIDLSSGSDAARSITSDTDYLYIVGNRRMEKRSKSDGSLIWAKPDSVPSTSITSDTDYLYVAGSNNDPGNFQWRIEKRSRTTGGVIWAQTSNPSSKTDSPSSITVNADYVYIVGYDSSPGNEQWRIEKRYKTNGNLIWAKTSNPSSGTDNPSSIIVDADSLYIAGSDDIPGNYQWRIEKRENIPCECTTGVCCDGCNYRPSSYLCNNNYQVEYGCPDGTSASDDVKRRYKDLYCSGTSASCTDDSFIWEDWTLYDNCDSCEYCTAGDSSCNSYCLGTDISCGCTSCTNCDNSDGGYDTGSTQWVSSGECTEKEQKEQIYRNYYCSGTSCAYSTGSTQWVDTGSTRNKVDGISCSDDGNSCTDDYCSSGSCIHPAYCSGTVASCGCTSCTNCASTNDYCDAGGGFQSGYNLATCTSYFCVPTICTSCSPYMASSSSSCKTSCTEDSDCWLAYYCDADHCVIPVLPTYSSFTSPETTNFSEEIDLTDVTNLTLAIENKGKIKFADEYGVNAHNEDYDSNIIIEDGIIFVNSSALHSSFNSSATLTFYNADCNAPHVYYSDTTTTRYSTIEEDNLCLAPICTNIQCSAGTLTVDVEHFTGYAIGSNTRLAIYDNYGDGNAPVNQDIIFYASYTNITGSPIIGATCDIDFDSAGSPSAMSYVGQRYEYTRSFAATGIHNYTINCAKLTFNTLNAKDVVGVSEVPSQIVSDADSWDQTVGDANHNVADLIYHSTGTFVVGTIFYSSQYDFFIKKLNSSGSLVWNRTFNYSNLDLARAFELDSNNNIIITGDCNNSDISICTVKYDNDGNLLWNRTFNQEGDTYVLGIDTDNADNIYLIGYYYNSTSGGYDSLLIKYNSSGDLEYSLIYDSGGDEKGGDVVVTSDGTIYMAVTEGLGSSQDMCLYVVSVFGFIANKHCFDTGGADIADSVVADEIDEEVVIYVGGRSGENPLNSSEPAQFQVNKYDEDAALLWNQNFSSDKKVQQVGKVTVVLDPTPNSNDVYISGSNYIHKPTDDTPESTYQSTYVKYSPSGTVRYSASSPVQSDSTVVPTIGQSTYYEGGNFAVLEQSEGEPPRVITYSTETISNYVERPIPKISGFVPSVDFLELPDLNSVENLTLKGENGAINFMNNITVENQNFETNVVIGECFISLNTTGLDSSMNAPSLLSIIDTGNCNGTTVFTVPGFHTTLNAAKLAAGRQICLDCTGKQRVGNRISFQIPHFTTYYLGSYANLVIYDSYEGSYVPANIDITFYANYTNSTSGEHIGGADCIIEFDDSPGTTFAMTDNGANYNFTKSDGFATEALHIWNVTCSNATGEWDILNLSNDVQVGIVAVIPEFSILTLGLGLIAVLIGLFVIRRRK